MSATNIHTISVLPEDLIITDDFDINTYRANLSLSTAATTAHDEEVLNVPTLLVPCATITSSETATAQASEAASLQASSQHIAEQIDDVATTNTASEAVTVVVSPHVVATEENSELATAKATEENSASSNVPYITFAQHMDARRPLTTAVEKAADVDCKLNE